ncbi:MAG: tol-pal system-associated acyl-CoA thioesterase [Pseudomonadota bacterium]|nr:tol-pal system-associated acyl-CoA thioesterase [Pseudomonadota bacterium]
MFEETIPATGRIENKIFAYPVRVYYEDTDAGGIVYYANYLKFAERARTEFIRNLGISQEKNLENDQTGFVVRSCHIEYLASARLDDALVVTCQVLEAGGASLVVRQEIYRGDTLLTKIEVKLIHMSLNLKRPVRIEAELGAKIKALI